MSTRTELQAAEAEKMKKATKAKKSPYVRDENPKLRAVVHGLRKLVKATVPGVKETVNSWGIPAFERKDPFCFFMVGKNHVTFGFHHGTSLEDPQRLLEGTGKNLRHVKLREAEDLRRPGLRRLVQTAARLKGTAPMPGMSGQKRPV